ncbi:TadE-like protein [Rheinheimera pacifica]|uniref:TadE-like protein n=1 Tax=Rheinheimera pacifica TaxID=173990 RepID=A0A1H6L7F5_9GAMM|nr:TadE/TadG family type IV pilus assembly protein [Rheinheimera pacifica]SEH81172.1 TadE-like protein [Rheinheimera pacifica]
MMTLKGNRGQSITEFIIVMPIFFILLFGIFEFAYIYRAKATLNTATFEAARAGALHHARIAPMRDALAKGMTPLYMKGKTVDDSALAMVNMSVAYGTAKAMAVAIDKVPAFNVKSVSIISPTQAIFDRFKVKRSVKLQYETNFSEHEFIPNDNLLFRSAQSVKLNSGGEEIDMNVQDANLLKIKTAWCYNMKVPLLKNLINTAVSGFWGGILTASDEQKTCNAIGLANGGVYMALTSQSTIRMQSHVVSDGSNLN